MSINDDILRSIGVSIPKIKFLRNLTSAVEQNLIDLDSFDSLDNQEIIATLSMVKGIRRWTLEMFLIFL